MHPRASAEFKQPHRFKLVTGGNIKGAKKGLTVRRAIVHPTFMLECKAVLGDVTMHRLPIRLGLLGSGHILPPTELNLHLFDHVENKSAIRAAICYYDIKASA